MSDLAQLLRDKLQPWTQHGVQERFIVAQPKMRVANMPPDVRLISRKIAGPRVVIKDGRCYQNARNIVAKWPEAGLQALGKYTLVCVLDGHVDYPVGNYKVQCGAGHFIFIAPGTPQPDGSRPYVNSEKSDSCELLYLLLHPNAVECWISQGDLQGKKQFHNSLLLDKQVVALFEVLMEEIFGDRERVGQIGENLLAVFVSVLQREIEAERFQHVPPLESSAPPEMTDPPQTDFLTRLENYVQPNLRQSLTLEVVSRAMYLSPAQFTRVVRRETGQSFNEFLAARRLQEAKRLLLNSQWSTAVVGKFVGFNSPTYFCTFFKRHAGQSPSEFRFHASKPQKSQN